MTRTSSLIPAVLIIACSPASTLDSASTATGESSPKSCRSDRPRKAPSSWMAWRLASEGVSRVRLPI